MKLTLTGECFGDFQDTEDCRRCWQSSACAEEAQALDGYWDKLADQEWEAIINGKWKEVEEEWTR